MKIEISIKTIFQLFLFVLCLWLIVKLYEILILLFIAYIISETLKPIIFFFKKKGIPFSFSVFLTYFLFLFLILIFIAIVYKPLVDQIKDLIKNLPEFFINALQKFFENTPSLKKQLNWEEFVVQIRESLVNEINFKNLSTSLSSGIKGFYGLLGSFFSSIVSFISTIALSIYFLSFSRETKIKALTILPFSNKKLAVEIFFEIEKQLGRWFRAQIFLMVIIGFLGWLGFLICGLSFAVPIGIIGGFLEAIPNIGPTVTWGLAVIVALGSNAPIWKILFVAIWFFLIQQVENYILIPKLIKKIIGVNPFLTLFMLLSATKIFGILGSLIAVPLAAIIQIVLNKLYEK